MENESMQHLIIIRGAGDLASGIALRLRHAGFSIVMTETAQPLAVRRTVSFSEAVHRGRMQVEDVEAVLAGSPEKAAAAAREGKVAVLVDPDGSCISRLRPAAVVNAIMAKSSAETRITDEPILIGVGPGFTAGVNCHAVVETMRGHTLGRVLYEGSALPDTGIPAMIGGYAEERLLKAPARGLFFPLRSIGDPVEAGDIVGIVRLQQSGTGGEPEVPVVCRIKGVLRGILPEGTPVTEGMKSGDVDPRDVAEYCHIVSEKALAVGGGVLEAILHFGVRA